MKRELNPPGSDLFPDSTDDNWLGSLTDAFWEVRLYGFNAGWEENVAARGGPADFGEGIVTPIGAAVGYDDPNGFDPITDMGRDLQQLIVLWAGWKVVLTRMGSLNTSFRAKAGPVEYETQNAASVLKGVLDQIKSKIDWILDRLSTYNSGASTAVFDAVIERSYSQAVGEVWWVK